MKIIRKKMFSIEWLRQSHNKQTNNTGNLPLAMKSTNCRRQYSYEIIINSDEISIKIIIPMGIDVKKSQQSDSNVHKM